MPNFVGFDSAEYRREFTNRGKVGTTNGLIGIGIKTVDFEKLREAYSTAIGTLFDDYGLKAETPAYCAAELSAILRSKNIDKEEEFLATFLSLILPHIEKIHFFYTHIFHLDKIIILGMTRMERIAFRFSARKRASRISMTWLAHPTR